jgi:hypothetical protein
MGPRLATLALVLMLGGCSTCSTWDECEPGIDRPCNYEGCGECYVARQECRENHQWGPCVCIDHDPPYDADDPDPWWDVPYDFHDEDRREPDLVDEDPVDPDVEDLFDLETSDLVDEDIADDDLEDADDGGEP